MNRAVRHAFAVSLIAFAAVVIIWPIAWSASMRVNRRAAREQSRQLAARSGSGASPVLDSVRSQQSQALKLKSQ
jgi:hypothetical protein